MPAAKALDRILKRERTIMTSPFSMPRLVALDLVNALTARQRQVVERIALGERREAIAAELGLSVRTLDVHITRVRDKWKVPVHGMGRIWFCACQAEGLP